MDECEEIAALKRIISMTLAAKWDDDQRAAAEALSKIEAEAVRAVVNYHSRRILG